MSNSTSLKPQRTAQDIAKEARKIIEKKSSPDEVGKESTSVSAITQTNEFAKIMFDPELAPEAKRDALVKALTFSKESSKEENRARLKQFAEFKEYLSEQRKVLNREGIKLQDTKAFAELQAVIDDMTASSISFQDKIKPLLEVLTAVFEIRSSDKITDVYREIQNDKVWQEEQGQILSDLENELKRTKDQFKDLYKEKARLLEDRTLFGLGGVRQSAKERISEIEQVEIKTLDKHMGDILARIEHQKNIISEGPSSDSPELKKQKGILKEFLDLTKDENINRQKDLINAAVNYVDTSDSRLKSVLSTLDRLGQHAEVVSDANSMLKNMHLIMDDSLKNVSEVNGGTRQTLTKPDPEESSIQRMTREERINDINEFISLIDDNAVDIANSIGGLAKHSVQIQAYKDTLRNESASTKRLHLEGVSQMGEQLMSVISAISAAATSESRSVAANNFAKMAEQNQMIISQEVVKNASNIELEANSIAKLVGELQDYGDVLNASSQIANQGYARMRETVEAIRKVSGAVQESINDLVSDRAEAGIASGDGSSESINEAREESPQGGFSNPFDRLKGNN